MSEEKKKPEEQPQPEIEEVITDFGDGVRVRSGFQIEEVGPGIMGVNIFGPIFEFDDDDDLEDEDLDLEDEDGNQEDHDEAEESP